MQDNVKFYREKNALSIKNANISTPNKNQLEKCLIDKLDEKANHVGVIFCEDLRNEYLQRKNKLDIAKTMKEFDVKKLLATRLSADLLQLYIDLSNVYNLPISFEIYDNYDCIEQEIEDLLIICCNELEKYEDKAPILKKLLSLTIKYASLFNLSFQDIQNEQIKVEDKEGSFYNGKIVVE